jgi:hypothetical protein
MVFNNHSTYAPTGSTKVWNLEPCSDTKSEGPEILQPIRHLPRTLVLMLYQSTSHLQTPNLSWLGLSFCYRSLIYLQLEDRSSQQHNARHNTQLWSCLTHRCVRENVRISFTNYIHNPRAQALPSNTVSYKQEALIVPPILALSLSLSSMSSCSNELDHNRRNGRSRSWPKLFATKLLILLCPYVFLKISPRL